MMLYIPVLLLRFQRKFTTVEYSSIRLLHCCSDVRPVKDRVSNQAQEGTLNKAHILL